jgi:hypothetical protein
LDINIATAVLLGATTLVMVVPGFGQTGSNVLSKQPSSMKARTVIVVTAVKNRIYCRLTFTMSGLKGDPDFRKKQGNSQICSHSVWPLHTKLLWFYFNRTMQITGANGAQHNLYPR